MQSIGSQKNELYGSGSNVIVIDVPVIQSFDIATQKTATFEKMEISCYEQTVSDDEPVVSADEFLVDRTGMDFNENKKISNKKLRAGLCLLKDEMKKYIQKTTLARSSQIVWFQSFFHIRCCACRKLIKTREKYRGVKDVNVNCFNRPIQFRVSFKSGKRSSKNGDMFNFHIADPDGEIQVTVFPEETASFFDLIEFNRTFELTNFNVKKEDSNFPLFLGNGKYICLLGSSKIEALDDNIISELKFNFVPIDGIKNLEPNSKCDVIGIIVKNWGKEIIGDNKVKRDVTITDKSKECIILTLWGEEYDEFDSEEIPIIIHNGVVHDYNESRTITCAARTLFWRNPSNSAAEELKLWFDDEKFD
ncbi:replication protein A 70 kDa DNA-binding subunit-like [Bradysia coprophila]|uniref:replication protein A 70 kDa DNA-binding subunit-like n=1 Tax=Bradysia coprophila TaxID=38358 RepID=UPI00187DB950|nr:replication protein A 70 kDa DNA-binding subunit-like [Bradysia coprophila]